jgi:hypothetical protein
MIRRVWVFVNPPETLSGGAFLESIWNLNVTDVAFMMNVSGDAAIPPLGPRRVAAVERFGLDLHNMNVTPHLVTWLWPEPGNMRRVAADLGPLCASFQRAVGGSLLFDLEGGWRREVGRMARRWRVPVLDAAERVMAAWEFHRWGLRLGVTSITAIGETRPDGSMPASRAVLAPVIARCHYVLPQAYWPNTQRRAHALWKTFQRPIVMGLSANPGIVGTPQQMRRIIAQVESLSAPTIEAVSYWQWKPFLTHAPARFSVVQQLAARARERAA